MRLLIEDEQKFINDMTKYRLAPRHILSALKDQNKDNPTCVTQIIKQRNVYRSNLKGPRTEMQQY